jgi:hypothetical protein
MYPLSQLALTVLATSHVHSDRFSCGEPFSVARDEGQRLKLLHGLCTGTQETGLLHCHIMKMVGLGMHRMNPGIASSDEDLRALLVIEGLPISV